MRCLNILETGSYQNQQGENIQIQSLQQKALQGTILYRPERLQALMQADIPTPRFNTVFAVNDLTTLDSVRAEFPQDNHVLCLNFASARNPGGGFLKGSQAQEESIARATGLYPCLLKAEDYYLANRRHDSCIYTDHIIYAPAVPVLMDEDGHLMERPITTAVLTAPAVNAGVVLRQEPEKADQIVPRMRQRIDMVLAICREQAHETLILGAWGCGVFRNDPVVIAKLFHELLIGKYAGQFRRVIFSVYARDDRFIQPFEQHFLS
ncbi:MAG: TIGR02452 family protein [Bacteroidota bacterium]